MTLREASDAPAMLAQAKEMMEATQALGDNHAKGLEQDQPMQRVYNDLYPRAVEAGYEPRVADHYARIVAAEASSAAEREPGIYPDAWDAYQRTGLQVQRGDAGAGLHQAAAMYRSPKSDVTLFAEHVLENPAAEDRILTMGQSRRAWLEKFRMQPE